MTEKHVASDDQLLDDGQEEVFSRAEVESGRLEHQVGAGDGSVQGDLGEANRGIGQDRVGEAPQDTPAGSPAAAAGGPGSGSGPTLEPPRAHAPSTEPRHAPPARGSHLDR
jgi:hypothetical protein